MQPFEWQLLLKLRRATVMALGLVGVLVAQSLFLHILAERRVLLTRSRLVAERPAVLDLVGSMHIMMLRLSMHVRRSGWGSTCWLC